MRIPPAASPLSPATPPQEPINAQGYEALMRVFRNRPELLSEAVDTFLSAPVKSPEFKQTEQRLIAMGALTPMAKPSGSESAQDKLDLFCKLSHPDDALTAQTQTGALAVVEAVRQQRPLLLQKLLGEGKMKAHYAQMSEPDRQRMQKVFQTALWQPHTGPLLEKLIRQGLKPSATQWNDLANRGDRRLLTRLAQIAQQQNTWPAHLSVAQLAETAHAQAQEVRALQMALKHALEDPDALAAQRSTLHQALSTDSFRALLQAHCQAGMKPSEQVYASPDDIFAGSPLPTTLLHAAVRKNQAGGLEALIDSNTDLNPRNPHGQTPVFMAIHLEHHAVLEPLLQAGANPNLPDHDGISPLYHATAGADTQSVDRLLKAGADPNQADHQERQTPLYRAAQMGETEILNQLLAAGADKDQADKNGLTPLHIAVSQGHVDAVTQLLTAGANTDPKNQYGWMPLHFATQAGRANVVAQLLAAGANPDPKDNDGWTPLHLAAAKGQADIVAQLLAVGAEKEPKDNNTGSTPLHVAAQAGHNNVVEQLLASGANKEQVNQEGRTPLYQAAIHGQAATINQLLTAGANKNKPDNRGHSPVWVATAFGQTEALAELLAAGADKDQADHDGVTPILAAVRYGQPGTLAQLLTAGANQNKEDAQGTTPLQIAQIAENQELVDLLKAHGATEPATR